jgi:hypothetical protein
VKLVVVKLQVFRKGKSLAQKMLQKRPAAQFYSYCCASMVLLAKPKIEVVALCKDNANDAACLEVEIMTLIIVPGV